MASRCLSSLLAFLVVFNVLLAVSEQAAAGRDIPSNNANNDDIKESEWFLKHDRSFLIPGVGRVMAPPLHSRLRFPPIRGNTGAGVSGGAPPARHIPGGDDTFVPNPGVEVPIPGGGGVPTPTKH